MEKQDLLVSLTTDHNFPGKASHCNVFCYLARSSLGRFFFVFSTQGLFSAFDFLHRSNRKELPHGNFCQVRDVNINMQMTWNTSDERLRRKFPQESRPLTRFWHLRSLLTLFENLFFSKYSRTSLIRTPKGQSKVSVLERSRRLRHF